MRNILSPSLLILITLLILSSCGQKAKKENEVLKVQVDSLNTELNTTMQAVNQLSEIGILLDTIESQRDIMRMEMVEGGIPRDDYERRIENLSNLLGDANNKIAELEQVRGGYASLVAKLKNELDDRNRELEAMEAILDTYKAENISMESTIILQENEIMDLETQIQTKEAELMLLEMKVDEMIDEMQLNEADAYYARAVAYEEAAKRTKLAPRKKKETLQQALDLYKQALALGNTEAQPKVDELSEKLN